MEIDDLIRNGHGAASLHIEERPLPETGDDFLEALRTLHGLIFTEGLPSIAGRFRLDGEDVEFGGASSHRIVGARFDVIEPRLIALHGDVLRERSFTGSKEAVADSCAFFLEEFFRIHPFSDGNGRVGRLVIRWACITWSRYRFGPFTTTPRARRRYRTALEFAHRYASNSEHPGRAFKSNPCAYLSRWLQEHLVEVPVNSGEEAEPPR